MITDQIYQLLQGSGRNQGPRGPETASPSNSFLPQGMGAPGGNGLSELLRRQTAYRGFDLGSLLQLLNSIIGDGGGGDGGNGDNGNGGNGGGGGGGGGCLCADVLVTMADGSTKRAAEIKVDDLILGMDGDAGHSIQTVTTVNSSRQPCYDVLLSDGSTIGASATHKWFTSRGLMHTPSLEPNTELVQIDGEAVTVVSIVPIGSQVVHWWNCDPNHCYFAGGVLHHNATALQTKDPILVPGAGYQPPVVGGTGGAG